MSVAEKAIHPLDVLEQKVDQAINAVLYALA